MDLIEAITRTQWLPAPLLDRWQSDAPLVVFTHGAIIDHHEWDATLLIVGEDFRVMAWDLPGHGLSRPAAFDLS